MGIPRGSRVVVFIGHEFDRKGLPVLLQAVKDLPDHHILVVGGTPRQIHAYRAGLSSDLSGRVHWAGRVPDPRSALAAGDILALPSAYEANPLVVLEALASGLQVVATPVGSIPQSLANDEVSRIVERTAGGVRDGLIALARVSLPRAQVQALARARVEAFNWGLVAETYLDLFLSLESRQVHSR
nr:glycosyltransferase family 4 protein [Ornithinimicrobium sp. F0845]